MAKRRKRTRRKKSDQLSFRDRVLVNLSLKLCMGVFVIVGFLTLAQCTVKTPEAPTWTTQFTLPLLNRTYEMSELITRVDDSALLVDSLGNPYFRIEEEIDSLALGATMNAPEVSVQVVETLGAVAIPQEDITPLLINFTDVIPFPAGVIPPLAFDYVFDSPTLAGFSSVLVKSGSFICSFSNNLGIALDTVKVDVYDLNTFQFIGTGQLPTVLSAGSTDTISIPLAGKTVSNRLRLQVRVHSPGGIVLSTSGLTLLTNMSLSDPFEIISGTAQIPSIDKTINQKVSLGAEHLIHSADLASGSLDLTFRNSSSLSADIVINLPDFNLGGIPLSVARTIAPAQVTMITVDLAGYLFAPADIVAPQEIDIQILAHIDSSGAGYIEFNGNDTLQVDANLSALEFSRIRGVFDSLTTSFTPVAQSIAVPSGFDSAQFTAATLTLEIDNGSQLSGTLNITITGSNGKSLNITGAINPGSSASPVTTAITENNLADFLNPIPSSVTISGDVTFGDGVSVIDITSADFIKARFKIESPLEVIFDGSTIELDATSSDIDTADISIVTEHLVQAQVNATIRNHLPAGLEFFIVISSDSATLYSAPELTIGPITIAAGQVDGSGVTVAETISDALIALDSADVQVFNNPIVFIGQTLTIASSGGQPIRFMGSDYISIDAMVTIEYKFNGEF